MDNGIINAILQATLLFISALFSIIIYFWRFQKENKRKVADDFVNTYILNGIDYNISIIQRLRLYLEYEPNSLKEIRDDIDYQRLFSVCFLIPSCGFRLVGLIYGLSDHVNSSTAIDIKERSDSWLRRITIFLEEIRDFIIGKKIQTINDIYRIRYDAIILEKCNALIKEMGLS